MNTLCGEAMYDPVVTHLAAMAVALSAAVVRLRLISKALRQSLSLPGILLNLAVGSNLALHGLLTSPLECSRT